MDDNSIKTCPLFPGPAYRPIFFRECFELVYHGGGGFSWSEVWNMPISHRRFNLKSIHEYLEKVEEMKSKNNEKLTDKSDMTSGVKIPDYINKLSQKEPTFTSKVKGKK
jgi:hypothetical protein